MPSFSYLAVDKNGKEIKGVLDAPTLEEAKQNLKRDGNLPINVVSASKLTSKLEVDLFEKKPVPRDLSLFCRQFVSLSSAGIPLVTSLEMLAEETENKMLGKAIHECGVSIQAGSSLTTAMDEHPKIFPELLRTMVAAGELSGTLDISFMRMGEQFEKEAKLKMMITRASVYPIAVLVIAFLVVLLMLAFAVPQFEKMLTDLGSDIPWLTKMVLAASEYMQFNWMWVLGGTGALVYGLIQFAKTPPGRELFSRIILKTPLFGKLSVKTASARMCRTLSSLIAAGVPLVDTLDIVADTMSNVMFKNAMKLAREDVMMGTPLSEALNRSKLFPPRVEHMAKVGEETGDLDGMFTRLADYYDEEVENTTAMIMSAMEPAIIVVLALTVGTIVVAVMLPIAEMYTALDNL